MNVPILKNWAVRWGSENPYLPPEANYRCVAGTIFGSEKFKDGDVIKTNRIAKSEGRLITTDSGSKYRLYGRPHKEYVKWMKENGVKYDGKNPIKFK